MVRKKNKRKGRRKQGGEQRLVQVGPNTPHGVCSERLSGFGGLLALVKFLDLLGYREVFERHYVLSRRVTRLGCYRMVLGMVVLLFIGFQRLGHFAYVREDPVLCGMLKVRRLPAVSTFWRYLASLGLVQGQGLLRVMAQLRQRVWQLLGYRPQRIHVDVDTTVSTVYGAIEGSRKGYNPKHRGKKGLRPVLCFVYETREYLCGQQRRGQTMNRQEVVKLIERFPRYLPPGVGQVVVRADEEFTGWAPVQACERCGYEFIFASSGCRLPLDEGGWCEHAGSEYQECRYQPKDWPAAYRFVVMRTVQPCPPSPQGTLLDLRHYKERVLVTNRLEPKPHEIFQEYDQRAAIEPLLGEAQREGVLAIASRRFQHHAAFFQLVMLAYNLWRWMQLLAGAQEKPRAGSDQDGAAAIPAQGLATLRIARLKMLYLATKVTFHNHRDRLLYSIHDVRTAAFRDFLRYLDRGRHKPPPWALRQAARR